MKLGCDGFRGWLCALGKEIVAQTQRPIKMEVWNRGWKCRVRFFKKNI
jgi:hypothetical protein